MFAILFLFFLQLISDFVGTIYALNLLAFSLSEGDLANLYLTFPEEAIEQVMIGVAKNVSTSLLLLSPVILLFFKGRFPNALMVALGEIMIICRIAEPIVPPRAKMLISGLGTGCFLIILPVYIQKKANSEQEGLELGIGLGLALIFSILFRTLGHGADLSTFRWFQGIGWILSAIGAVLIWVLWTRDSESDKATPRLQQKVVAAGVWKVTGLCVGIIGILTLVDFVFSSPAVIARWTEGNYTMILGMVVVLAAILIIFAVFKPNLINHVSRWVVWFWNGAFVLTLVLTIVIHQTALPPEAGIYPVIAAPTTIFKQLPLFFMLLLSPILIIDFTLLLRELIKSLPTIRKMGVGFFISCVLLLFIVFAVIFTLIWDYIPGIGPLFRDSIDRVMLICALAGVVPVLLIKWEKGFFQKPVIQGKVQWILAVVVSIVSIGTIAAAILSEVRPGIQEENKDSIKVLTYNVQTGYDTSGVWNFDGQLEVIRQEQPDIIGIQESDTCRISGGNTDIVRFLANKLKYYSYFGPKTVTGTFGIALLSKYPIENTVTFYMYSESEQTATIEASIPIGNTSYNVFVTHLGNYGPIEQQQNILHRVRGRNQVILMGDFNFERDSEQYAVTTALLHDSRQIAENKEDEPEGGKQVVDHIFVSAGIRVTGYKHTGGNNSDHPAVVVTIQK